MPKRHRRLLAIYAVALLLGALAIAPVLERRETVIRLDDQPALLSSSYAGKGERESVLFCPKPTATPTREPTSTPEPTATPTEEPEPTSTPEPTATLTEEPEPTSTPEPTATLTEEPEPTSTPEPTATPTEEPEPTATPTEEPEPAATPIEESEPTATPTQKPEPTPTPGGSGREPTRASLASDVETPPPFLPETGGQRGPLNMGGAAWMGVGLILVLVGLSLYRAKLHRTTGNQAIGEGKG